MKTIQRTLASAACILGLLLSAGCAALTPVDTKQEPLAERVKQFMQAQIDKKWDRVYSFYESSYRARVTRDGFVARPRSLSFTGFRIEEIQVLPAGDQATVNIKVDILVMGYEFKGGPQTQYWIKEKGEWFFKAEPQQQRSPFGSQEKK